MFDASRFELSQRNGTTRSFLMACSTDLTHISTRKCRCVGDPKRVVRRKRKPTLRISDCVSFHCCCRNHKLEITNLRIKDEYNQDFRFMIVTVSTKIGYRLPKKLVSIQKEWSMSTTNGDDGYQHELKALLKQPKQPQSFSLWRHQHAL